MHNDSDLPAIADTRLRFAAALRRGDAKAASEVYAAAAKLLPPSAELVDGRDAIEEFWRAGVEAGVADVSVEPLALERSDALAYEIGRYRLLLHSEEGGTIVDRGKYVLVHERQDDGTWHRAVEMLSPDAPPTYDNTIDREDR
jgi:ketosteroid isomerase-like protein